MNDRKRRSLTNVGGEIDVGGNPDEGQVLAHALDVAPTPEADAPDRAHVHGFHAYPARAHPVTVRRLVEGFSTEGKTVLDPFCGSGTVLIEAMLAGRNAVGTDLNPLAVMLARSKTYPRKPEATAALVEAARGVAAFADARRKAKSGATRRLPQEDVAIFAPHVLLELDGIRAGIAEAPPGVRPDLLLVLSSILVKLSQKKGDTSDEAVEKRIGQGYPARLFVRKTEELARRFDEFTQLLPSPPPRARVVLDDATALSKLDDASVDAVITSPPYVATYDYLAHHDLRMRWLDLDTRRFAQGELGARRNYDRRSALDARKSWEEELRRFFEAIARVTRPGSPIILLIADSAVPSGPRGGGAEPLWADEIVGDVVGRFRSLTAVARASQARPHFHGPTASAFRDRARAEHLLLVRRR